MTTATRHHRSELLQIFELRSFPAVRRKWDKLSTKEKRAVLDELDGDITERWALQVISDIHRDRDQ